MSSELFVPEFRPIEIVADPFSLDSLRYDTPCRIEEAKKDILLTPSAVTEFMHKLSEVSDQDDRLMVIGIGTGGTIAMSHKGPENTLVPDLNFDSILEMTDPRMKEEFNVLSFDAFATDSSQLDINDVGDLAIAMSYIWDNMPTAQRNKFAGFLIVHGTDTMPKSGAHLDMMLGQDVPFNFVHTGAQKSINEKINDAQRNVKESLYTLKMLHQDSKAEGITVMGGNALLTCGISKISDHNAVAMWTYLHKPVLEWNALPDPDKDHLPKWLRAKPLTDGGFLPTVYRGPNRIGTLQAEMQEDPVYIDAAVNYSGRLAMMLVTYGANTYDVMALAQIGKSARNSDQDIPLFAISPVNANPDLESYAVSQTMQEWGIQPVYMTDSALHAKAMRVISESQRDSRFTSLTSEQRNTFIKAAIVKNFIGEVPTEENRRTS